MEDRLPPNEYSEYFGPDAVLQPPIVKEKENQNTPRYLEQVPVSSHCDVPYLIVRMSKEGGFESAVESKTRTEAYFSRMLHMRTTKVNKALQILLFVSLQLRTQIAQNLAHLKGPPGVQFHERAPDAMDVDELPNLEAKARLPLECRALAVAGFEGRLKCFCQGGHGHAVPKSYDLPIKQ